MNICMYLRKSRKDMEAERHGDGDTLKKHRRLLTDFADRAGYQISMVYEEVASGESISGRPEMQRLLSDLYANKWDGVLVVEIERLTRGDHKDQGIIFEAFKYTNTLIITPTKTYDLQKEDDARYCNFGLFMSNMEYETINRRLHTGRYLSAMDGNYMGSIAPFGYDRIRNKVGSGYTLTPNDDAAAVKIMFEMYAAGGHSIHDISNRIKELGYHPAQKDTFTTTAILNILKNPIYNGKIRIGYKKIRREFAGGTLKKVAHYGKEYYDIVDGKHPPIIDDDLWQRVQDTYGSKHRTIDNRVFRNEFAGLIFCRCGAKIHLQTYNKKYYALICDHQKACGSSSVPYRKFKDRFINALNGELEDVRINRTTAAMPSQSKKKSLESKLDAKRKAENVQYSMLENGVYSLELFTERHNQLTAEIQAIQNELHAIQSEIDRANQAAHRRESLHAAIEMLQDDGIDPEVKNRFLRRIIDRVELYRERGADDFEMIVTLK